MKPFFLLLSFVAFSIICAAQRVEQYLDYQLKPVAEDRAVYFSITDIAGDRFHRRIFYIREDRLQRDGYYADSKCTVKEGEFFYFYPDRNLEMTCNFSKNKLHGMYLSFHNNGMLKDSVHYEKGKPVGYSFGLHANGMYKDSTVINEDGSGVAISWYENGMPSAAGYFAAGRKQRGTWQYFHKNGHPSARELYDEGKLLERKYYDEQGQQQTDTTSTDHALSFTGGEGAWPRYVAVNAKIPEGWDLPAGDSVVLMVSAVIDEEGKVTNAYVSAPYHPAFDKIALQLMIASPPWIPAVDHHRKIKTTLKVPITFKRREGL
ncbi:MAG: hypothetical protein JWP81_3203 [Ferruginibacter sp.]|nr:hypothetical protein [Ferruginibacter sp.]